MFDVTSVVAGYGGNTVLHGISLTIQANERVGIFGHNGSGKSTLLRCLVGDMAEMEGQISFAGRRVIPGQVHRNVRLGIGFVPQSNNVFASLAVEDCLRIAGLNSRRSLDDMFVLFPALRDRRRQRAGSLSGGERQLVAVSMALMTRPQVLLLDEPTAGLSPVRATEVLHNLEHVSRFENTGLVLIEQNVLPALAVVDRAIVLRGGRVVFDGSTAKLQREQDLWELF
jgi:branched-chain amino acid transport system ATP-binding protein